MARIRSQVVNSGNDSDGEDSQLPNTFLVNSGNSDIEDVEHDEYAELFAGLGESAEEKVLLYRIAPGSQKQGLLCRLDPGTSVEDIKPRFGGGDYVIKRLRSGMIMKSARLYVEGDPIFEQPKKEPEALPQQSPHVDIRELFAAMQESNRQLLQGIVQVIQPQQNSEVAMLEKLSMYKNLFASPHVEPQGNMMEMFIKGMEIGRESAPRDGEAGASDVLLEAVKSFAPVIAQSVTAGANTAPHPVITAPQGAQSSQEGANMNMQDLALKGALGFLVRQAAAGKDASLYAEVVLDQVPEDKIRALLADSSYMQLLAEKNPDVTKFPGWFGELRAHILEILTGNSPGDISVAHAATDNDTTGNPAG